MLKQTTKALLESFRYQRIAYLPKDNRCWAWNDTITIRQNVAQWYLIDRKQLGNATVRMNEIKALDYRKHLATLQSTNGGENNAIPYSLTINLSA